MLVPFDTVPNATNVEHVLSEVASKRVDSLINVTQLKLATLTRLTFLWKFFGLFIQMAMHFAIGNSICPQSIAFGKGGANFNYLILYTAG